MGRMQFPLCCSFTKDGLKTVIISQPSAFQWSSVKLLCYNDRMGKVDAAGLLDELRFPQESQPKCQKFSGRRRALLLFSDTVPSYGFMNWTINFLSLSRRSGLKTKPTKRSFTSTGGRGISHEVWMNCRSSFSLVNNHWIWHICHLHARNSLAVT